MEINITPARPEDSEQIAAIARTVIENGLPHTWTADRVLAQIQHAESAIIVARDGRRFAGFAGMRFFDDYAHLLLLAVRRGHRRRGIGRSLMGWFEACARTAGTFEIRLERRAGNVDALAFYERLGFRDCGVASGYYSGREDAVRMSRDLTRTPAAL